jgi:hypothetical protein
VSISRTTTCGGDLMPIEGWSAWCTAFCAHAGPGVMHSLHRPGEPCWQAPRLSDQPTAGAVAGTIRTQHSGKP